MIYKIFRCVKVWHIYLLHTLIYVAKTCQTRKWSAKVHVIWLSWRLHDWYEASVWGYWVASSYFYTLISFQWNLQRPLRLHVKTTLTLHLIRTSIIIRPSPFDVYNVSVKTRLPIFLQGNEICNLLDAL